MLSTVLVTTEPSLLVAVVTISVVEMGMATPPPPEVSLGPPESVVVTGEPSLLVPVETTSVEVAVAVAVSEPDSLPPEVETAKTVAVGEDMTEESY